MPGFPDHARFALVQLDDDGVLCSLTSLEDPDLRFLVVPPVPFFPDYAPAVDDEAVTALGIDGADDVLVLCVLTAGETLAGTTANLVAPVLVNTSTNRAPAGGPRRPGALGRHAARGVIDPSSPGLRPRTVAWRHAGPEPSCG